jgi:hypothetical protein
MTGNFLQENPARNAWREAVMEVADKARAVMPDGSSRIAAAVKIVLSGEVELLEDGTAKVCSQSNGKMEYHVAHGACLCKDFAKAPYSYCKHRLSHAIYGHAKVLTATKLQQLDAPQEPLTTPVLPPEPPRHC